MIFFFIFLTYFTLYNRHSFSSASLELTQMHSFLWLSNIPLCILYMYHDIFIHSSANVLLACFHVLSIVNSAAMTNRIHVSFSILVSSGYMPRSWIARSHQLDHQKSKRVPEKHLFLLY